MANLILLLLLLFPVVAGAVCDCSNTTVTNIPQTECEALMALYNSTNGQDWKNSENWNTNTACSEWYGVSVDAQHVVGLELYINKLSGTIPAEIGNLNNLQELDLDINQLSGSIPDDLGNLKDLWFLGLSTNQLTGSIPVRLGELAKLEELYLDSNQLTGSLPPALGNLSKLIELELDKNLLTGSLPSEWSSMTALESLYLDQNKFNGQIPSSWTTMTKLILFYLSQNQLGGIIPSEIINLNNLQELDLGYNKFSTTDPDVLEFLGPPFNKNPQWSVTQTIPPSDVSLTVISRHSIKVSWTIIPYTEDGGYYRIKYSLNSGGTYNTTAATENKLTSEFIINNLQPATTYFFVIETITPAHGTQKNTLTSTLSPEVSATTKVDYGDLNADRAVDLKDLIIALQISTGTSISQISIDADTNNDDRIGMIDALFILRSLVQI